jgi:hypothetical protein
MGTAGRVKRRNLNMCEVTRNILPPFLIDSVAFGKSSLSTENLFSRERNPQLAAEYRFSGTARPDVAMRERL